MRPDTTPPTPPPILVVTPQEAFARLLDKQLRGQGHAVDWARSAYEGLMMFRQRLPCLILVDRSEPSQDGLRAAAAKASVLFVGIQIPGVPCPEEACSEELQAGSDAVICTDSYREIAARVRAILRRQQFHGAPKSHYEVGPIRMNLDRHEVTVGGRDIVLTLKEFQILRCFLEAPEKVFTRQDLLNRVWGEGYALEEHTLDVHVYSLRQKIEANPARPVYILTVRGIGYKLRTE